MMIKALEPLCILHLNIEKDQEMQKSGKGRDISRARPLPNRWGEGQEAKARLELYGGLQGRRKEGDHHDHPDHRDCHDYDDCDHISLKLY